LLCSFSCGRAFQGLSANEFRGLRFEASKPGDLKTGEQVLERLSFGDCGIATPLRREIGILGFFYNASVYLLQRREPKFVMLLPPAAEETLEGRMMPSCSGLLFVRGVLLP